MILQLPNSTTAGRSGESSRRPAVSSSRDDADPYRSCTTDISPGAAYKISNGQINPPMGSSDPKRTSSRRHASQVRNYDSTLKGMETLSLDNEEKVHY